MQEKTAGGTPAAPIKLDVSVRIIEPVKNLMGFASVKFNDCFVVENLKIVQGSKGLFVGMPSQPDGKGGYRAGKGRTAPEGKAQPWGGALTSGHNGPKQKGGGNHATQTGGL